jgi:predicted phage gp36 major capsid-like protein
VAEAIQTEFEKWRSECELIDAEMNRLALARLSGSEHERQLRKAQFASLVERRNQAARELLRTRASVIRRVRPIISGKLKPPKG